jgi:hypothetical protein
MGKFDQEYYFIRRASSEERPSLLADSDTEDRIFDSENQLVGSAPFVFLNNLKDEQLRKKIEGIVPDIMFVGTDLVVSNSIRENLLLENIPHLYMHPSVYIDNNDNWNENYWYLNFQSTLDCWDREFSEYDDEIEPIKIGIEEFREVFSFSLNEKILEKIPLPDRRLFKMGGTVAATVTCHKSLYSIFNRDGKSGANVIRISDY